MIIASLFAVSISAFMIYYKHKLTGVYEEHVSYYSSFIIIPCITIYISFKAFYHNRRLPELPVRFITSVGSCTFGIYLLHIMIKDWSPVSDLWGILQDKVHLNFMITAFVICIVTMVLGYLVTFIIKKIPGLNRLV